jgi:hypothetical protein
MMLNGLADAKTATVSISSSPPIGATPSPDDLGLAGELLGVTNSPSGWLLRASSRRTSQEASSRRVPPLSKSPRQSLSKLVMHPGHIVSVHSVQLFNERARGFGTLRSNFFLATSR